MQVANAAAAELEANITEAALAKQRVMDAPTIPHYWAIHVRWSLRFISCILGTYVVMGYFSDPTF